MVVTELRLNVVLLCSDAAEMDVTVHGRLLRRLMQHTITCGDAATLANVPDEVQARVAAEMQDVLEAMAVRDHNIAIPARLREHALHNNSNNNNNSGNSSRVSPLLHSRSAASVVVLDEKRPATSAQDGNDAEREKGAQGDNSNTTPGGGGGARKPRGSVMNSNHNVTPSAATSPMAAGRRRPSMASAMMHAAAAAEEEKEKAALVQTFLPHSECILVSAGVAEPMLHLLQWAQGNYARWRARQDDVHTHKENEENIVRTQNYNHKANALSTPVVFVYELPNEAALVQAAEEDMAELPHDEVEARAACERMHATAFRRALKQSVLTALQQQHHLHEQAQAQAAGEEELLVVWCVRHVALLQALLTSAEPDEAGAVHSAHGQGEQSTANVNTTTTQAGAAGGGNAGARKSVQSSPMKGKGGGGEESSSGNHNNNSKTVRASSASRANAAASGARRSNARHASNMLVTAESYSANESPGSTPHAHVAVAADTYRVSIIAPRMMLYIEEDEGEEGREEEEREADGQAHGRGSNATSNLTTSANDGHNNNSNSNSAASQSASGTGKSNTRSSESKRGNAGASAKKPGSAATHRADNANSTNNSNSKKTRGAGKGAMSPTTAGNAARNFDAFSEDQHQQHHHNQQQKHSMNDEDDAMQAEGSTDEANRSESDERVWEKMAYQSCTCFEDAVEVQRRWQRRWGRLCAQRQAALYPPWADIRYDPRRFGQWLSEETARLVQSTSHPHEDNQCNYHTSGAEEYTSTAYRRSRAASARRESVNAKALASPLEMMIVEDHYTALTQSCISPTRLSSAMVVLGSRAGTSCEPVWCITVCPQPLLPAQLQVQLQQQSPQGEQGQQQENNNNYNNTTTSVVPALPMARCCNASLSAALRCAQRLLTCLAAYNAWRRTKCLTTLPDGYSVKSEDAVQNSSARAALQAPPIDTLRQRCRDALHACGVCATNTCTKNTASNTLCRTFTSCSSVSSGGVGEVCSASEMVRQLCAQASHGQVQRSTPQCLVQPCDDHTAALLAGVGEYWWCLRAEKDDKERHTRGHPAIKESTLRLRDYVATNSHNNNNNNDAHVPLQAWLVHCDRRYYNGNKCGGNTAPGAGSEPHTVHFAEQGESTTTASAAAAAGGGGARNDGQDANSNSNNNNNGAEGRSAALSLSASDEPRRSVLAQRPSSRRAASPLTERLTNTSAAPPPTASDATNSSSGGGVPHQPERLCVLPVAAQAAQSAQEEAEENVGAIDAMLRATLMRSTGLAVTLPSSPQEKAHDGAAEHHTSLSVHPCVRSVYDKARQAAVQQTVEDVTVHLHAQQPHPLHPREDATKGSSHEEEAAAQESAMCEPTALHILHPLLHNTNTQPAPPAAAYSSSSPTTTIVATAAKKTRTASPRATRAAAGAAMNHTNTSRTTTTTTTTAMSNSNTNAYSNTNTQWLSPHTRRCTDRERQHVLRHVLLNAMASACGILSEQACEATTTTATSQAIGSDATRKGCARSALCALPRPVEEPLTSSEAWRRLLAYRQRYGPHNCGFVCYTHVLEAHNPALPTHGVRRLWLIGTQKNKHNTQGEDGDDMCSRRQHRVWLHAIHGLPPLTTFLTLQRWLAETSGEVGTMTENKENKAAHVMCTAGGVSSRAVMHALLTRYLTQPVVQRCAADIHRTPCGVPQKGAELASSAGNDEPNSKPSSHTAPQGVAAQPPRYVLESRETLYPHCDALIELTTTACGRVCRYVKSREAMAALHYGISATPPLTPNTSPSSASGEKDTAAYLSVRFDEDEVLFTCAPCHAETTPSSQQQNNSNKESEGAPLLSAVRAGKRKGQARDTESVTSTTSTNAAGGNATSRTRRTGNTNTAGQKTGNERRSRRSSQLSAQGISDTKATTATTTTTTTTTTSASATTHNNTNMSGSVSLPPMNAALTPLDAYGHVRLWSHATPVTTKRAAQSRSRRTSAVNTNNNSSSGSSGSNAALPFDQRIKPLNVWVTSRDCVLSVPDVSAQQPAQPAHLQLTYRRAASLQPLCPTHHNSNNNNNNSSRTSTEGVARQPACELVYCVHDYVGSLSQLRPSLEQERRRTVLLESGVVVRYFAGTRCVEQRLYPDGTTLTRFRRTRHAAGTATRTKRANVKDAEVYVDTLTMPSGTRYVRCTSQESRAGKAGGAAHTTSGFVRLTDMSNKENTAQMCQAAHCVCGVASYDASEHCKLWCREDGLRCVTYQRVFTGTHEDSKGNHTQADGDVLAAMTQAEDVLRVVVHGDGTSLVTLLHHKAASATTTDKTPHTGKQACSVHDAASQWVMSPVVRALLRECALVQRACPGYAVRWLVESPYAPRIFILDLVQESSNNNMIMMNGCKEMTTSKNDASAGAKDASSAAKSGALRGAFYAVFGDGSVLVRHATRPNISLLAQDAADGMDSRVRENASAGVMQTRFTRPTQTTVRVLHESNLVLLEPSEVIARHHAQPAAAAVQEGTVVFDLGLGGVRLVDYVRNVHTVSHVFAAPAMVRSTLGNAASRRASRHDNTMNTNEAGVVMQDMAERANAAAVVAKPRAGSAHIAMDAHVTAAAASVQVQQTSKKAAQDTLSGSAHESEEAVVKMRTEPHTWGTLLRALVGENYTTHRLPQAQQSAWRAAQDAQRARIAAAARTGRCLPLIERLRALAEPIITAYELLRVDHLHRLEHEDGTPPGMAHTSSNSVMSQTGVSETRAHEATQHAGPASLRPLCIPPLYMAELDTTRSRSSDGGAFVQLLDEAALREECRRAQYVAESVAAGEPHIVQHTLYRAACPHKETNDVVLHARPELMGEEDAEKVLGAMRFHCGSMQPVTTAQLYVTQTGNDKSTKANAKDEECKGTARGLSSFACAAAVRQSGSRWLPAALQPPRRFLAKEASSTWSAMTTTDNSQDAHVQQEQQSQRRQRVFLRYTGLERSVAEALVCSAVQDDLARSQALRSNRARMTM